MVRRFVVVVGVLALSIASRSPLLAATFYVSPSGSDSASGTIETPFRSVQHGASVLSPGDTLVILPGTYAEAVVLSRGGTPQAPVLISAEPGAELVSPDPSASLSAFDVRGDVGHVSFHGIQASGGYHETLFLRPGSHDIRIEDCRITGNRAGLWIAGAERVVVERCVFSGNSAHGVRIYQGSREVTIRASQADRNDDGRGCAGDADGFVVAADTDAILIEDCRAFANGEDGFDFQGPVIVRRSVSTANGCSGFKFFRGGRGENLISAQNRVGVSVTAADPELSTLTLEHGTFADNSQQQVLLYSPLPGFGPGSYRVSLRNSILVGTGKVLEAEAGVSLEESFNLMFRPDSTEALVVLQDRSGRRQFSGQDVNAGPYRAATGLGFGTYAMDPSFESSEDLYQLSADSPAVDSADTQSEVPDDARQQRRPLGQRPDRGATESAFTVWNHAPWPDPGPTREVVAGQWFRVSPYGSADVDGDPLSLRWTFEAPDRTVTGANPGHLFPLPGTYRIVLTASDGSLTTSRAVEVRAVLPPSTHTAHESAVLPREPLSVRFRGSQTASKRVLRVRVRNGDPSVVEEPFGHLVRLLAMDGTCPAGTVVGEADFESRLPGAQNVALVAPGRTRAARVELSVSRLAGSSCLLLLRVETVHPGNTEPDPTNNETWVEIRTRG